MAHQYRMPALDGLRGIAALAVVIYHYEGVAFGTPSHDRFFKIGELGVELFFIISGFVILLSLDRARNVQQFVYNRFMRLYPAYWSSLIPAGTALLAAGKFDLTVFIINITMFQSFVGVRDVVQAYWTLGYELWFYVVIGLVAALGYLKYTVRIALGWLGVCVLMQLLKPQILTTLNADGWEIIIKIFRADYVQFFIAGIAIFHIFQRRDVLVSWMTLIAATSYTAFGHVGGTSPSVYVGVTAVFVTSVLLAATGRLTWLEGRIPVLLGTWSYSIYLLHLPLARLLAMGAEAVGSTRVVGVILAVPVCFALAALVSRWIERPALAWSRKVSLARPLAVGS